jgi:hypothetical protein
MSSCVRFLETLQRKKRHKKKESFFSRKRFFPVSLGMTEMMIVIRNDGAGYGSQQIHYRKESTSKKLKLSFTRDTTKTKDTAEQDSKK